MLLYYTSRGRKSRDYPVMKENERLNINYYFKRDQRSGNLVQTVSHSNYTLPHF